MPSENATLPWMPCPKSEDGGHDWTEYQTGYGYNECLKCGLSSQHHAIGGYCNAAARHIAGLQREVERLKAQLAAIASSPVPLTTARKRKINFEETPYDAGRPWPKGVQP